MVSQSERAAWTPRPGSLLPLHHIQTPSPLFASLSRSHFIFLSLSEAPFLQSTSQLSGSTLIFDPGPSSGLHCHPSRWILRYEPALSSLNKEFGLKYDATICSLYGLRKVVAIYPWMSIFCNGRLRPDYHFVDTSRVEFQRWDREY